MTDASRTTGEAAALIFAQPADLHALKAAFPAAWDEVYAELAGVATATPAVLARRMHDAAADWRARAGFEARVMNDPGGALTLTVATSRMRLLALEQLARALVQVATPPVRHAWLDRLFRPLARRAALAPRALPLAVHEARWARLRDRPAAAVDLHKRGCYCVYPQELVAALAQRLGARPTLELGAGRGLLARYLAAAGVDIVAIDDHSWAHTIPMGPEVRREEAGAALAARAPAAVVCAWPPPGNPFEQRVFTTRSVELYIVLLSRHPFASGDWAAYARQRSFDHEVADDLARLVYPPEVEATCLVFTRKPRDGGRRGR